MSDTAHTTIRTQGESSRIAWGIHDAVATITLGNGARRNVRRTEDSHILAGLVHELDRRPDIGAFVLRGRGSTFGSGSDMTECVGASATQVDEPFALMERALTAIGRVTVASVAMLQRIVASARSQLALTCSVRVADISLSIGMLILRWGIRPSSIFFKRLAGLLALGSTMNARQAREAVLIIETVKPDSLEGAVEEALARFVMQQPRALVAAAAQTEILSTRSGKQYCEWAYRRPSRVSQADRRQVSGVGYSLIYDGIAMAILHEFYHKRILTNAY